MAAAPDRVFYVFATNSWMPFSPTETPLDLVVSAWNPVGFGGPAYHIPGLLVIYLAQLLSPSSYFAEILYSALPYLLPSCSMLFLLTRIFAGSLVYSYNWVTIAQSGNFPLLYPYATAPLVVWFCATIAERDGSRWRTELGLAGSVFLGTIFYPVVGISLLLPAILIGFLWGLFKLRRSMRGFAGYLLALALSFLLYVLVSLPFSLPQIIGILQRGGLGYYTQVGFQVASTSLAQIGPAGFPSVFGTRYSVFALLAEPKVIGIEMVAGLLIMVVAIGFEAQRRRFAGLAWPSIFVLAVLYGLVVLIEQGNTVINTIYAILPILFPLDGVAPYYIVIGYVSGIVLAVFISDIGMVLSNRVSSKSKGRLGLKLFILTVVDISSLFVLNHQGEILYFQGLNQATYDSSSEKYPETTPAYLSNLTQHFNVVRQTTGPFRVLWVPQEYWESAMITTLSLSDSFAAGGLRNSAPLYSSLSNAITQLKSGNHSFSETVGRLGFRYIVVLKSLNQSTDIGISGGADAYISGNPSKFITSLESQPYILLVSQNSDYALFAVIDPSYLSPAIFWASSNPELGVTSPGSSVRVSQVSPHYSPSHYTIQVNSTGPTWIIFADN
jgi:hypothetical protein